MNMRYAVILGLIVTSPVAAQEEAEEGPWSGKATLGYLATSGNTENTSLNSGFEVNYASGSWLHSLIGTAVNAAQQEETTAEAYTLGWKTEYNFSETDYLFGKIDWRKDRFSGFEQQVSETVGYGRRLIDNANHVLNGQLGVGAKQLDSIDGTSDEDFIVTGGLDYTWTFSETAQFTQDLVIEYGETNTYLESVSAIRATLIGDLALVASYTIKNNSDVPAGVDETDTFTALSLEYAF